jgi:hypothetical protein
MRWGLSTLNDLHESSSSHDMRWGLPTFNEALSLPNDPLSPLSTLTAAVTAADHFSFSADGTLSLEAQVAQALLEVCMCVYIRIYVCMYAHSVRVK